MAEDPDAVHRFYVAIRNIRRGRSQIPLAYWAHGRDDLDVTQMGVLMALVENPGGLSIRDLAAGEQIDAGNASRTAAKLADGGLLCREPSAADGRSVLVKATPAGFALGRKLIQRRDEFIGRVLGTFRTSEREHVISILERIDLAFQEFASSMLIDAPRERVRRMPGAAPRRTSLR
jgi:DNA-binding MarR family transcriptional regulator